MQMGKVHESVKDTCRWERHTQIGKIHADGKGTCRWERHMHMEKKDVKNRMQKGNAHQRDAHTMKVYSDPHQTMMTL